MVILGYLVTIIDTCINVDFIESNPTILQLPVSQYSATVARKLNFSPLFLPAERKFGKKTNKQKKMIKYGRERTPS